MFRAHYLSMLAMLCISLPGTAMSESFHAGIARISSPTAIGQAVTAVWYPTEQPEEVWQAGPFEIAATQDAPVAEGRFPVVLLSHGRQGAPLSHRELAAHLAREGFIVIAPTHAGDAAGQPSLPLDEVLRNRPAQAVAAFEAALQDARIAPHADPDRIGMIGYSAGGYTSLILAGALPNFTLAVEYCEDEGREDIGTCGTDDSTFSGMAGDMPSFSALSSPRLTALVLLDPLAVMFDASSVADLKAPVLLYRPQDDRYMSSLANAVALARSLPQPVRSIVLPGHHFTFVDPCPEAIAADAAMVCNDDPGIDRPALHRTFENEITDFLNGHL